MYALTHVLNEAFLAVVGACSTRDADAQIPLETMHIVKPLRLCLYVAIFYDVVFYHHLHDDALLRGAGFSHYASVGYHAWSANSASYEILSQSVAFYYYFCVYHEYFYVYHPKNALNVFFLTCSTFHDFRSGVYYDGTSDFPAICGLY